MSSDLKDARWGLAGFLAEKDGVDFYSIFYDDKSRYLRAAQVRLDAEPDDVEYWAERFREGG